MPGGRRALPTEGRFPYPNKVKALALLFCLTLPSAAAPNADLVLVQAFRARAQLPPLSAVEMGRLGKAPELVSAAKLEAAQAFLDKINPNFDSTITPESRFIENPALIEMKRDVAAAREVLIQAKVYQVRDTLLEGERVDPDKLDAVFNGSKSLAKRAAVLDGAAAKNVEHLILDGAPRHARRSLDALVKHAPGIAKGPHKQTVERLRRDLKTMPESRPVKAFERRLAEAKELFRRREYGLALSAARSLMDAVLATPAREATKRALWMDASSLESDVRRYGAAAIYGAYGGWKADALAERVKRLPYKGDPIRPEPTRVQCHGDCAVQQAYNHPKLRALEKVISYADFLDGVTGLLKSEVRDDGMGDVDTRIVLRQLGFQPVWRRAGSEAQLLEALDAHGALITTIRWTPPKSPLDRRGNHAVVLQGAFQEDGRWNYVVIDSNYARPQVMPYEDLMVLGASRFESVEPLPGGAKIEQGGLELRDTWAPLGRRPPLWRRLLAALGWPAR